FTRRSRSRRSLTGAPAPEPLLAHLVTLHERTHGLGDTLELLVGELREHRQGEHLFRDALRDREVALPVAQELRGLLEVDRDGVVDLRPDAAVAEVLAQRVSAAAGHPDAVDVKA